MGFLWRLLGEETTTTPSPSKSDSFTKDLSSKTEALTKVGDNLITTIQKVMQVVMPIVLAAVLAMGVFFCVKLGIGYAKAEKTEDREEAKKRLVGAVIGFGIGIIAAVVMWILFTNRSILEGLFV